MMKQLNGPCYIAYYYCAVLYMLPYLQSTGALDCLCSDCEVGSVCHSISGACFVQFSYSDHVQKRGCVDLASVSEICLDQSDEGIVCCYSNECNHWSLAYNRQVRIEKNRTGMEDEESSSRQVEILESVAIISGAICTFFMIIGISVSISLFYCHCCYHRRDRERTVDIECGEPSPSTVTSQGPVAFPPQGISLGTLSSTSTYPLSSLQQRHIVQHTQLDKNLEKGRFCSTHIGHWRRDKVIVKRYGEKAEKIWLTESEIHQLPYMRHDNIHCFYASDRQILTPDSNQHHFIILEYHRHGTLYEYLHKTVLHPYHVVTFAMSIADGLAFLHSENEKKKISIAHRNISSESIYIKSNDTCCISDFSLAVTSTDSSTSDPADLKERPDPDYRYLAPEFLAEPPAPSSMDNLKKADMYSYGLVLWEIARRCAVLGMVEDVCLPYSSYLQHTPVQRHEIRDLVLSQDQRPPVPDQWNRDEAMRIILRTITECWHGNSTVRLTPLRVKKTLEKLSQQIQPRMYDKNGKLLSFYREGDIMPSETEMT